METRSFPIGEVISYHRNPRRGDVDLIAASLKKRGQYRPIVVNKGTHTGRPFEILAGNHTWMAAKQLGWTEIHASVVDVDDESAREIVLADNRLADLGTYDEDVLAELLSQVDDLESVGFSDADLDALLGIDEPVSLTDPDDVPQAPEAARTVCQAGDVIDLGGSRLFVGDATDLEAVRANAPGLADCVWTDPPYGVSYVGKTADALTIANDGAGDLPDLIPAAFKTMVACACPGAPVYIAHPDAERILFEESMASAGMVFRQNLIWVKNHMVLGRSDYHYKHEPILFGYIPDHEPVLYGFTEGGKGRLGRGGERWYGDHKQTTVFNVAKPKRNGEHPTMKPVELIEAMLVNSCPRGGLVLDVFGGSGSTLIAAYRLSMRAYLVELDPVYADVIVKRWAAHTGRTPTRGGEPLIFEE
ncbi:DNA modification methylase [Trueperella sp. HMSC08H06]|nr:DNA modification methylase [Trueperella sp. HMSC08H06]